MVNLQGNYSLIHAGHNDMFEFETFDTVHCGQPESRRATIFGDAPADSIIRYSNCFNSGLVLIKQFIRACHQADIIQINA
jgi:hypothetical protein